MKAIAALIPLVLVMAGCPVWTPDPPGDIESLVDPATNGEYCLYVPTWYTPEETWPLMISLHGTFGYDGPRRQVQELAYYADKYGFILAAPALESVQGITPVEPGMWRKDLARDREVVYSLIDKLSGEFNIDTKTICLSGFSAGGFVMYDAGLREPERFQLLLGRSINTSFDIFERIDFTDEARRQRIHIFWGKSDPADKMGWKAYEYLRMRDFLNTTMKEYSGGHKRRPREACTIWMLEWDP
ncbi:MAG: hypothetical protein ACYTFO_11605, partial [Planctomycetota bacterium]